MPNIQVKCQLIQSHHPDTDTYKHIPECRVMAMPGPL